MTAFCILACMVKYRIGLLYAVYLVINEDTGCIVIARVCAPVAISCDVTLSLRGCLHPWQSHTWNKYSCYTFLMAEIATLALLARNDKGIPHEIATLALLARNDKGTLHSHTMTTPARHCEGIYARGNPIHGTRKVATPFSWLRLPRSRCSLAMTRVYRRGLPRSLHSLAMTRAYRKGLPRSFHSLAMTTPARHCEGIYARGNLLRNTRTIRLKNRGGHVILYV